MDRQKFTVTQPTEIRFGCGAIDDLAEAVQGLGGTKALLVVDPNLKSVGLLDTIIAPLKGDPLWSPDGQWLVFQIDYQNNMEVFAIRVNGLQETRLTTDAAYDGEPHWIWD